MQSPTWQDLLTEGVNYDTYANLIWLPIVTGQGDERMRAVYGHILSASQIWVTRVEGSSPTSMPVVPLVPESIETIKERWFAAIEKTAFDLPVPYRNTRGDAFTRSFGDILRHALNHGTYHRGQIRQLAEDAGIDFPDTDFIGYTFERDNL